MATTTQGKGQKNGFVSVRFDRDLLAFLKRRAKANHRSVGGEIRCLVAAAKEKNGQ